MCFRWRCRQEAMTLLWMTPPQNRRHTPTWNVVVKVHVSRLVARWDIHSLPTIGSRTLPNTTPPDRDNLGADIGAQMRHDLFLYGVLYLINTKAAADAVEACANVYRSTHPGMHFFVAFLHSTRGKMSHVHSTPTLCIVGTLPLHSSASSGQVDGWTWSTII